MDVAERPAMVALAAGLSIVLAYVHGRSVKRTSTAVVVPVSFVISALLLLLEWGLVTRLPDVAAR